MIPDTPVIRVAVLCGSYGVVRFSFFKPRLPQDPSGLGGIDEIDGQIFDLVGRQT